MTPLLEVENLEKQFGFDKPPLTRFGMMLWNYARFDFGQSYFRDISVLNLILEKMPVSISTWQVAGLDVDGSPQPAMTGCHQPSERFHGTVVPFAWFAQGLRLVDFADPYNPREVGHYLPEPAAGADRASSNDVTVDSRGLVYLVDRVNGVDIIETTAFS